MSNKQNIIVNLQHLFSTFIEQSKPIVTHIHKVSIIEAHFHGEYSANGHRHIIAIIGVEVKPAFDAYSVST